MDTSGEEKRKSSVGRLCSLCRNNRAALKRPKTLEQVGLVSSPFRVFRKPPLTIFPGSLLITDQEFSFKSYADTWVISSEFIIFLPFPGNSNFYLN